MGSLVIKKSIIAALVVALGIAGQSVQAESVPDETLQSEKVQTEKVQAEKTETDLFSPVEQIMNPFYPKYPPTKPATGEQAELIKTW